MKDAGMVPVKGVKDIGDIKGTKALEKVYNPGASIHDEILRSVHQTSVNMELRNHLELNTKMKLGKEY